MSLLICVRTVPSYIMQTPEHSCNYHFVQLTRNNKHWCFFLYIYKSSNKKVHTSITFLCKYLLNISIVVKILFFTSQFPPSKKKFAQYFCIFYTCFQQLGFSTKPVHVMFSWMFHLSWQKNADGVLEVMFLTCNMDSLV